MALKELQFAAVPDASQIDAFEREAATLKTLSHPAIPRFIRSFSEGSGVNLRLYLASEFIEGESLAARIDRAPLSEAELFAAARQILKVLAYLHRHADKGDQFGVDAVNLPLQRAPAPGELVPGQLRGGTSCPRTAYQHVAQGHRPQ